MITRVVGSKKREQSGEFICEYYGPHRDTKPLYADGARNADIFMEIDTKEMFMFDEENNAWV
jgi:hypothetical protein